MDKERDLNQVTIDSRIRYVSDICRIMEKLGVSADPVEVLRVSNLLGWAKRRRFGIPLRKNLDDKDSLQAIGGMGPAMFAEDSGLEELELMGGAKFIDPYIRTMADLIDILNEFGVKKSDEVVTMAMVDAMDIKEQRIKENDEDMARILEERLNRIRRSIDE